MSLLSTRDVQRNQLGQLGWLVKPRVTNSYVLQSMCLSTSSKELAIRFEPFKVGDETAAVIFLLILDTTIPYGVSIVFEGTLVELLLL